MAVLPRDGPFFSSRAGERVNEGGPSVWCRTSLTRNFSLFVRSSVWFGHGGHAPPSYVQQYIRSVILRSMSFTFYEETRTVQGIKAFAQVFVLSLVFCPELSQSVTRRQCCQRFSSLEVNEVRHHSLGTIPHCGRPAGRVQHFSPSTADCSSRITSFFFSCARAYFIFFSLAAVGSGSAAPPEGSRRGRREALHAAGFHGFHGLGNGSGCRESGPPSLPQANGGAYSSKTCNDYFYLQLYLYLFLQDVVGVNAPRNSGHSGGSSWSVVCNRLRVTYVSVAHARIPLEETASVRLLSNFEEEVTV